EKHATHPARMYPASGAFALERLRLRGASVFRGLNRQTEAAPSFAFFKGRVSRTSEAMEFAWRTERGYPETDIREANCQHGFGKFEAGLKDARFETIQRVETPGEAARPQSRPSAGPCLRCNGNVGCGRPRWPGSQPFRRCRGSSR